ncbi:amino acid ABC transporter permease [Stenomitos frigidus AS-A4]|uniref:Amino acid ABC transporter permease n=1 Tax=Stenomitos frigidus AS-A4 TaxID=2933935 RepID=A0ABV0KDR0_9CYAN|nr:amino acid ABC transporter permease [Phormidium sp. FACHB-592]
MRKRILTALIPGRSRWAIVALQTFLVIVFVSSLVAQPLLPSIAQDRPNSSIEHTAFISEFPQGTIVAQAPVAPPADASPSQRGLNLDFGRIQPDIPFILAGIPVTLIFTLSSVLLGLVWGAVLSLCKISGVKLLQWLSFFYTSIFRGTPLLLQLSLVYFATPQLTGYNITPYQAGVLTFTLNSGAYMSETIRAGIQAVDKGQAEASLSLGIPYWLMMWDVIMPQALKNILPALVNETISLLKDSALVSTIGVVEILRAAQIVGANKYIYFEPLLFAGLIYYVLVMGLTYAASTLERRLRRSE